MHARVRMRHDVRTFMRILGSASERYHQDGDAREEDVVENLPQEPRSPDNVYIYASICMRIITCMHTYYYIYLPLSSDILHQDDTLVSTCVNYSQHGIICHMLLTYVQDNTIPRTT